MQGLQGAYGSVQVKAEPAQSKGPVDGRPALDQLPGLLEAVGSQTLQSQDPEARTQVSRAARHNCVPLLQADPLLVTVALAIGQHWLEYQVPRLGVEPLHRPPSQRDHLSPHGAVPEPLP